MDYTLTTIAMSSNIMIIISAFIAGGIILALFLHTEEQRKRLEWQQVHVESAQKRAEDAEERAESAKERAENAEEQVEIMKDDLKKEKSRKNSYVFYLGLRQLLGCSAEYRAMLRE